MVCRFVEDERGRSHHERLSQGQARTLAGGEGVERAVPRDAAEAEPRQSRAYSALERPHVEGLGFRREAVVFLGYGRREAFGRFGHARCQPFEAFAQAEGTAQGRIEGVADRGGAFRIARADVKRGVGARVRKAAKADVEPARRR